jgi:hypothetical protein
MNLVSREERTEAAWGLLPYYHPKLAKIGPLLKRFLCNGDERRGGYRETNREAGGLLFAAAFAVNSALPDGRI